MDDTGLFGGINPKWFCSQEHNLQTCCAPNICWFLNVAADQFFLPVSPVINFFFFPIIWQFYPTIIKSGAPGGAIFHCALDVKNRRLGFAGCQTFQMLYLKAILWCSVEYWESGLKCKMMCEKQLDPDTHICICT